MIHHYDRRSELILDDALTPLLVVTWVGPATLGLVAKFQEWADQQVESAKAQRTLVVLITDGTRAARPPADIRRALADLKMDTTVVVRSYVVLTNPLVRGAMTAIAWMVGDHFSVISSKTMNEAIDDASAYVRSRGLFPPSDGEFARYWARAPRQMSVG